MTLDELNRISNELAEAELLKCCGSSRWARQLTETRPFSTSHDLSQKASNIWWALPEEDWLEAFRAHPKIGEKKAESAQSAQAQQWSAQEQCESARPTTETKAALADGNRKYEEQFGYIFIICATGKSADEILAALKERLGNDPETELRVAADEQQKITQLRLKKLLET